MTKTRGLWALALVATACGGGGGGKQDGQVSDGAVIDAPIDSAMMMTMADGAIVDAAAIDAAPAIDSALVPDAATPDGAVAIDAAQPDGAIADAAPDAAPPIVSATITPGAGGTLTSADGRVTIVFPANAVSAATTVSITARSPSDVSREAVPAGVGYELAPDGIQFALPASVTYRLSSAEMGAAEAVNGVAPLPSDAAHLTLLIPFSTTSAGAVEPLHQSAMQAEATGFKATGKLSHFSVIDARLVPIELGFRPAINWDGVVGGPPTEFITWALEEANWHPCGQCTGLPPPDFTIVSLEYVVPPEVDISFPNGRRTLPTPCPRNQTATSEELERVQALCTATGMGPFGFRITGHFAASSLMGWKFGTEDISFERLFTATCRAHPAAAITSFTPQTGPSGTVVTVMGTELGGTGAIVMINGTTAVVQAGSTETSLTIVVPAGATSGPITVTTAFGTGTSTTSFVVPPPPAITSFTPASGMVGATVTINGQNLTGGHLTVQFNGTTASISQVNPGSLIVTVPAGATTGNITVSTDDGTAISATVFTVVAPPPVITSFTPMSGPVGTTVTLFGDNISGVGAVVKFNGTTASQVGGTATSLTVTVPAGATTGKITVTTSGGTATSTLDFTVTVPEVPCRVGNCPLTERASGTTMALQKLAAGNGNFVAGARGEDSVSHDDGVTFTAETGTPIWGALAYDPSTLGFLGAIDSTNLLRQSLNGNLPWSSLASNLPSAFLGVLANIGTNWCAGSGRKIYYSVDKATGGWTLANTPTAISGTILAIRAVSATRLVAVGHNGSAPRVWTSDDNGVNWVDEPTALRGGNAYLSDVVVFGPKVIAVGGMMGTPAPLIMSSDDYGITWDPITAVVGTQVLNGVCATPTTLIAVGNGGDIRLSSDGINFTSTSLPGGATTNLFQCAVGNSHIVISGNFGKLYGTAK